jgi:O-antigen ligase
MAWQQNWRVPASIRSGTGPGVCCLLHVVLPKAMATHNNYIDILAQTGLIGFAFYIVIFGVVA